MRFYLFVTVVSVAIWTYLYYYAFSKAPDDAAVLLQQRSSDGEENGPINIGMEVNRNAAKPGRDVAEMDQISPGARQVERCIVMPERDPAPVSQKRSGRQYPPACARDDPDSPWWNHKFVVVQNHVDREFALFGKELSYRQRSEWLSGLAKVTKHLLSRHSIEGWFLSSGTALGAYRCGDVLPWDVDCDIIVPEEGIRKLYTSVFNRSDYDYSRRQGAQIDERFRIKTKELCIPLAVVDTTNGYYCDIFTLNRIRASDGTEWLERPFVVDYGCTGAGSRVTPPRFLHEDIYPTCTCNLGAETYPCANRLRHTLEVELGPDIEKPNVLVAM